MVPLLDQSFIIFFLATYHEQEILNQTGSRSCGREWNNFDVVGFFDRVCFPVTITGNTSNIFKVAFLICRSRLRFYRFNFYFENRTAVPSLGQCLFLTANKQSRKEKILAQRGCRIRFPSEFDRDFLWAPIGNTWFFFLSVSYFFAFFEHFSDENGIILMKSGSLIVSVYL